MLLDVGVVEVVKSLKMEERYVGLVQLGARVGGLEGLRDSG
jgi:hypothetical protein